MPKEKAREDRVVIGWGDSATLGKSLARKTNTAFAPLSVSVFPDGELLVRLPVPVEGKVVVLIQSLHAPNQKILEIVFAATTAKELGAKKVVLVAPYLCYMRQDKRFHVGEAVAGTVVARLLSRYIDQLVTMDPHLHRHASLGEIYTCETTRLTAADAIAEFIHNNVKNPIVVGPDEESLQWAKRVSGDLKAEVHVLSKTRYSSEKVNIDFDSEKSLEGRGVVIVDDIISTGHTMMEVVKDVKKLGAKNIFCIGVHGIFAKHAYEKLRQLNTKVVTCNTIPHKSNRIDCSGILAEALK